MSHVLAEELKMEFEKLTNITCRAQYFEKGNTHKPTTLKMDEKGVYVFLTENYCFKVGKAGPKSQARWNSQHYNLDTSTPSTFPKSIMQNLNRFKKFFPKNKHAEIDELCKQNIKQWIKENVSRIEFVIFANEPKHALNLLEALVQFRLRPKYEGRDENE